jgi:hypothetical protein
MSHHGMSHHIHHLRCHTHHLRCRTHHSFRHHSL